MAIVGHQQRPAQDVLQVVVVQVYHCAEEQSVSPRAQAQGLWPAILMGMVVCHQGVLSVM